MRSDLEFLQLGTSGRRILRTVVGLEHARWISRQARRSISARRIIVVGAAVTAPHLTLQYQLQLITTKCPRQLW